VCGAKGLKGSEGPKRYYNFVHTLSLPCPYLVFILILPLPHAQPARHRRRCTRETNRREAVREGCTLT